MTVGLVAVLFVAAALVAAGAFAMVWRRDAVAALAGIPLMFGGAGVAFAGVARFSARIVIGVSGPPLGQEAAVLFAVVALAAVAFGIALSVRAAITSSPDRETRR